MPTKRTKPCGMKIDRDRAHKKTLFQWEIFLKIYFDYTVILVELQVGEQKMSGRVVFAQNLAYNRAENFHAKEGES